MGTVTIRCLLTYFKLDVHVLYISSNGHCNKRQVAAGECMYRARILKHSMEAEKSTFHGELSFQRSECTAGFTVAKIFVLCFKHFFVLTVWKNKKFGKMTPHLHFTLNISAYLFDSLEFALSAQPSFKNLSEFGLCIICKICWTINNNKRLLFLHIMTVVKHKMYFCFSTTTYLPEAFVLWPAVHIWQTDQRWIANIFVCLKGVCHEIFRVLFWHVWIDLGMYKNLWLF